METTKQKALLWWNSMSNFTRDELALEYCATYNIMDYEIEFIYLEEVPQEKLYTEKELKEICHKVLNMGMTLRQNQLAGYDGKSGNELLEEYFKENL